MMVFHFAVFKKMPMFKCHHSKVVYSLAYLCYCFDNSSHPADFEYSMLCSSLSHPSRAIATPCVVTLKGEESEGTLQCDIPHSKHEESLSVGSLFSGVFLCSELTYMKVSGLSASFV